MYKIPGVHDVVGLVSVDKLIFSNFPWRNLGDFCFTSSNKIAPDAHSQRKSKSFEVYHKMIAYSLNKNLDGEQILKDIQKLLDKLSPDSWNKNVLTISIQPIAYTVVDKLEYKGKL